MPDETTPKRRRAGTTRPKRSRRARATSLPVEPALPEGTSHAGPVGGDGAISDEEERQGLAAELDEGIRRIQAATPGYEPPPFSAQGLIQLIERNLDRLTPAVGLGLLKKLRGTLGGEFFDLDTWKGLWYMLNYSLQYQGDLLKHRLTGEYETDEWGLDPEVLQTVRPFFEFLYRHYWRVTTIGLEHVPGEGPALLVGNHSGQLPWDGAMVATSVLVDHPSQRLVRSLYATWFSTLPFFSSLFTKCGQVLATEENGTRLLQQDQLVAVYPEGFKGVGKLFKERYRLARFGRGGFARMALRTRAPIVPVAIVGAEETYISLRKSATMAKLTGFPYFPISPTFPWLGLIGFIPLPTKWTIEFGEPIPTTGYSGDAHRDLVLVSQLTDRVRNIVQDMIFRRLAERRSLFMG